MKMPLSYAKRRAFHSKLLAWFRENSRDFPWRRTRDPWRILLAEVLLQKTLAAKVVGVYEQIAEEYPAPDDLAHADVRHLKRLIRPLGLEFRAHQLKGIAKWLVAEEGGHVPDTATHLLRIKGVGPYTASAVLAFAFQKRIGIVDANVARIFKRLFGLSDPLKGLDYAPHMREIADSLLPMKRVRDYNLALLDFGALVCRSAGPKCDQCPFREDCAYGGTFGDCHPAKSCGIKT